MGILEKENSPKEQFLYNLQWTIWQIELIEQLKIQLMCNKFWLKELINRKSKCGWNCNLQHVNTLVTRLYVVYSKPILPCIDRPKHFQVESSLVNPAGLFPGKWSDYRNSTIETLKSFLFQTTVIFHISSQINISPILMENDNSYFLSSSEMKELRASFEVKNKHQKQLMRHACWEPSFRQKLKDYTFLHKYFCSDIF